MIFEKVKEYVDTSFKHDAAQILHFDRTVYWLKQLRPDADETFLIAAYGHDIERAFRSPDHDHAKTGKKFTDPEFIEHHQKEGARIIGEFLKKNGASPEMIEKVQHLVGAHEVGGDEEQNLLKDADSLSFVENNTQIFIKRLPLLGYDRIREKFDWMYERITDPKAKEIAKPFYDKMIAELDAVSR